MQSYNNKLLHKIRHHLNNGGVIAYPTESCYGFGCDPLNYKAIHKIIQLKGRNKNKGLIIVAGKINQLHKLILPLNDKTRQELKRYWPGFNTIVLPTAKFAPKILTGKHNKIAVRISRHDLIRQICNFLNMSLVSTSANRSGYKSIITYRDCIRQFGKQVMVLPGTTSFFKHPSTIIDWETRQKIR